DVFQHIIFGSLISTLIGSLLSLIIAFEIITKKSKLKYQSLYFFNEVMIVGGLMLLWYYIENIVMLFSILTILSFLYQIYKLLVGIYSMDKRFRLLILSLGTNHNEYSLFILEKNLGKLFGNLLKFYTLTLISFFASLTPFASNIGFFSLIVGLFLSLLQVD
ncbi:MAG: hypothetical protein ACK40U_06315, partial [Fervidobacterium pennivorans]